jgi:aspartate 1-decarboxylase
MLIPFLISKIHRATVTSVNLDYSGSISIDEDIMEVANLKPYQKVEIYNISNGHRFSTYVITGKRGSKEILLNGAAARLSSPGDSIIIAAYALIDEKELNSLSATILIMKDRNEIQKKIDGKL